MQSNNLNRPKCGVGVFVINPSTNEILIGKRKDNSRFAKPGGWLERGEELEECGSRELFEETNLKINPKRLKHIKTINCINTDDNYHNVAIYLLVELEINEISQIINKEPEKCENWYWVNFEFLEKNYFDLFFPLKVFLSKTKIKSIKELLKLNN